MTEVLTCDVEYITERKSSSSFNQVHGGLGCVLLSNIRATLNLLSLSRPETERSETPVQIQA